MPDGRIQDRHQEGESQEQRQGGGDTGHLFRIIARFLAEDVFHPGEPSHHGRESEGGQSLHRCVAELFVSRSRIESFARMAVGSALLAGGNGDPQFDELASLPI